MHLSDNMFGAVVLLSHWRAFVCPIPSLNFWPSSFPQALLLFSVYLSAAAAAATQQHCCSKNPMPLNWLLYVALCGTRVRVKNCYKLPMPVPSIQPIQLVLRTFAVCDLFPHHIVLVRNPFPPVAIYSSLDGCMPAFKYMLTPKNQDPQHVWFIRHRNRIRTLNVLRGSSMCKLLYKFVSWVECRQAHAKYEDGWLKSEKFRLHFDLYFIRIIEWMELICNAHKIQSNRGTGATYERRRRRQGQTMEWN